MIEESTTADDAVALALCGRVAVITIANPPVNALSTAVRAGLMRCIRLAQQDPHCEGILLTGEGRAFIGGADIHEFGKPRQPPMLPEVCDALESSAQPVVAAIHGACLGGGLEVALSAHYRIATDDAKIGLPEVSLGLLPGSGGTQRTTRLAGASAALDLILSGRHASAREALAMGLVDRLAAGGDLRAAGLAYLAELLAAGAGPRRTRNAIQGLADEAANRAALAVARAEQEKKSRGLFSPFCIVDCVEAALDRPFAQGMAFERSQFLACEASPQRQGLVHAFFAERETAKVPEARLFTVRPVQAAGVIGGGTMGAGITVALLDAGLPVTMVERDDAALARGRSLVEKVYDGLIAKGRMDAADKARVMARYSGSTRYEDLAQADLVIEAVFEDMQVKKEVFASLDRCCKPGCVLATNTSYLDIDEMAASVSRPEDVIGLHFFSPANIMRLIEIVVPAQVAPDVVATGFELAKKLRKVPVRAGVCDGFIGNRILAAYKLAGDYLVEDGASPYQVDGAMRDFGFAMGMFQVSDLAGGDIGWAARKRRAPTRDARQRYVEIADRLCERGWFGQKTGRGFYRYEPGSRAGKEDAEVLGIVDQERHRTGITPRGFSDEEIMRRIMAAMVNEGCRILDEGIALRPLDIDAVFVHGYGFPRWRGGPMFHADMVGLASVLADLQAFALRDAFFWQPAPLLENLVRDGRTLSSLNTLETA